MKLACILFAAMVAMAGGVYAEAAAGAAAMAVPVLKQAVQKGDVITPDNIISMQVPVTQVYASTITNPEQLAGLQAVRPLAAQVPINNLHVRLAPVMARNASIILRYRQGGIELTGKGQALEDGKLGQSVRVLNPSTRTTLVGVVASGNMVDIN